MVIIIEAVAKTLRVEDGKKLEDEIMVSVSSSVVDVIHFVAEEEAFALLSMIAVALILNHVVAERFTLGDGVGDNAMRVALFGVEETINSVVLLQRALNDSVLAFCTVLVGDSASEGTVCVVLNGGGG